MERIDKRNSNLELLRIILMLSVVMHHCIFASGIEQYYDLDNNAVNTVLMQFAGAWGKTAINAYVLITGYFMCKSSLTWKKVLKLFLEIKFYEIIIYIIFCLLGIGGGVTLKSIFKLMFSIGLNINHSFTASFVVFYLFIPFYNKLINSMSKNEFIRLLLLMITVFTGVGTFLSNFEVFSHLTWYTVLYFIAAYIRNYPNQWSESRKLNKILFFISFISAYASIYAIDIFNKRIGIDVNPYYFVMNSHKILALLISIFIFLWFKNMDIRQNKVINSIAATTFGILLIHTNSDTMSDLIWNKILHVTGIVSQSPLFLVGYILFATVIVFFACMIIDLIRIYAIENPFFRYIDKNTETIENKAKLFMERIATCLKRVNSKFSNEV